MTLRERVSGETDSWSSWAHGKGGREKERGRERERARQAEARESEKGRRGTAPLPPLWPPALPSSTPQTPSPWPPRMQIPGLRPKYRNSKPVQIAGTTRRFTHAHAPTSFHPLTGPTTHLVSFKPNPRKIPKLSHPFFPPFSHLPPIYLYLPPPSLTPLFSFP